MPANEYAFSTQWRVITPIELDYGRQIVATFVMADLQADFQMESRVAHAAWLHATGNRAPSFDVTVTFFS